MAKTTYACFIWLTWSCIWNKGVFQWVFWLTAAVSECITVTFSICLMHKWMTMRCRGWLGESPSAGSLYGNWWRHIRTHSYIVLETDATEVLVYRITLQVGNCWQRSTDLVIEICWCFVYARHALGVAPMTAVPVCGSITLVQMEKS